ncbi:hypothetical protein ABTW96_23185 [Nocardia beijingensis]|uniref:hypothetical protein n=1 Tax=Nocardia beijingensis TaxID=95162 RepID=UPI0033209180
MTGRLPHRCLRVLRLAQPQKSFDLRQTAFLVQRLERRVPSLVQRLERRLPFLLGCRRACLGRFALHAGGVGRFSRRLFSGVGGFAFLILARHRELLCHPFGGFPFDPFPFGLRCLGCSPGPLGVCSGLPVAFDLRRICPATGSGFPELLHLPEFLGTLLCPRDLAYLRQPFPRPVGSIQLVRPDQLQLLRYQRLAESHRAQGVSAGNDHVLEFVTEVADHRLQFGGHGWRDFLAGHRLPSRMGQLAGFQSDSFDAQLPQRLLLVDSPRLALDTSDTSSFRAG